MVGLTFQQKKTISNQIIFKRNTKANLLSQNSATSETVTSAQYNFDNVIGGLVYKPNVQYSLELTIDAKPFVMSCIIYLFPEDKTKREIVINLDQITKNNFSTISFTVPNLERTNYRYRIVGTDYFNVTTVLEGDIQMVGPTGDIGPPGPIGPIGPIGYAGPAGSIGATGEVGFEGSMGATGSIGFAGLKGATGPDGSKQLWLLDLSKNITTLANIGIGVTGPTESLVTEGTMNIRGNLSAKNVLVDNVLNTDLISIGKTSTGSLDISGNTIITGNLAIHGNTSDYNVDISGNVNIQTELLLSKLYKNYGRPVVINESTIQLDYKNGDEYYFPIIENNIQNDLTSNYTCILLNLPENVKKNLYTPYVITIMHNYKDVYTRKYYCQTVKIGGKIYTPQFNGVIPDDSKLKEIFVQKLTIIYYSATNIKIFCDIFNYDL